GLAVDAFDGAPNIFTRIRLPVEEIAPAVGAVAGRLPAAEDEGDRLVARIAGGGQVAPGVGGIASMDADRIAMHAAERLVRLDFVLPAAAVAQDELVDRQRNR